MILTNSIRDQYFEQINAILSLVIELGKTWDVHPVDMHNLLIIDVGDKRYGHLVIWITKDVSKECYRVELHVPRDTMTFFVDNQSKLYPKVLRIYTAALGFLLQPDKVNAALQNFISYLEMTRHELLSSKR